MKRLLSVVLTVAVLFMTCVMPVSAAESSDSVEGNNITAITSGTTYFSKITRKLNSLYGAVDSVNLSSGSCLGTNRQITSVTVYCRVSSGSSPFTLIVTSPSHVELRVLHIRLQILMVKIHLELGMSGFRLMALYQL